MEPCSTLKGGAFWPSTSTVCSSPHPSIVLIHWTYPLDSSIGATHLLGARDAADNLMKWNGARIRAVAARSQALFLRVATAAAETLPLPVHPRLTLLLALTSLSSWLSIDEGNTKRRGRKGSRPDETPPPPPYVVGPCRHDMECPLRTGEFCRFQQKVYPCTLHPPETWMLRSTLECSLVGLVLRAQLAAERRHSGCLPSERSRRMLYVVCCDPRRGAGGWWVALTSVRPWMRVRPQGTLERGERDEICH